MEALAARTAFVVGTQLSIKPCRPDVKKKCYEQRACCYPSTSSNLNDSSSANVFFVCTFVLVNIFSFFSIVRAFLIEEQKIVKKVLLEKQRAKKAAKTA